MPTETLDAVRTAKTEDFNDVLANWLRQTYSEVFGIVPDLAAAKYENVEDAFRGYTPPGQRGRMVTLFIGLCDFAGLIPKDSPLLGAVRTKRGGEPDKPKFSKQARRMAAAATRGSNDGVGAVQQRRADPPDSRMSKGDLLDALNAPDMALDPMILGLVQRLPPVDSEWPDANREAWLSAARAVFQVLYSLPPEAEAG